MFKATSYMTHNKDFSIIRDIALSTSVAILQDDSGKDVRLGDLWLERPAALIFLGHYG